MKKRKLSFKRKLLLHKEIISDLQQGFILGGGGAEPVPATRKPDSCSCSEQSCPGVTTCPTIPRGGQNCVMC